MAGGVKNLPGGTVKLERTAGWQVDRIGHLGNQCRSHQTREVGDRIGQTVPLLLGEIDGRSAELVSNVVDAGDVVRMGVGEHDGYGL